MKKFKTFTIVLFIMFILTGCFAKEEPVPITVSNSSAVKSKPNSLEPTSRKLQNDLEHLNDNPKPNDNSNQGKYVNSPDDKIKEINGFVLLSSLDKDIVIDLKYATTDNFTKKIIYPNKVCALRKSTAHKLSQANAELKKLGYRIKVWDAYRPIYVQQMFWDIVKDSRFVANPENGGSIHNKGCAVDVTLVDKNGNELNMPSKFDDFSPTAYRTNSKMTNEAKKHMDLLTKYMTNNGFTTIDTEWWHFYDVDSKNYKVTDINLELFLEKN